MSLRKRLNQVSIGVICSLLIVPALTSANEIEDNIQEALEAYAKGEIQETKEILQYVTSLLEAQTANSFANHLPDAPQGWEKHVLDTTDEVAAMAILGSGLSAKAQYTHESGKKMSINITGDSPMIAMLGAQFSNPAILAQMGDLKRINRQQVLISSDGPVQSLIANRFMVQIEGNVDVEDKLALFKMIDIKALKAF